MAKKNNKDQDLLWKQIEDHEWRIKQIISKFYPDGVRVDFMKATHIGKIMIDSTVTQHFSEDKQAQLECFKMIEDAEKKGSTSIDIDFFCNTSIFQNLLCDDPDACLMFKTAPEGIPVYVQQGFVLEGITPRFLIDSKEKEAILVLEDCNSRDTDIDFMSRDSSFIHLSEFHAIISGYDDNDTSDYNTTGKLCSMVSYSQSDGRCAIEKIYDHNVSLIEQLFPTIDSVDESSAGIDSQTESVIVTSEGT